MPLCKLFIATSIDGFIARPDGTLDWLPGSDATEEQPSEAEGDDFGYYAFYETIDLLIMGRSTYNEVLGFGVDWPYPDKLTYILTSEEGYEPPTENTLSLNTLNAQTLATLKGMSKKNIWVVGGGNVITQFLNMDAIEEMTLTIAPVILGKGVQLFPNEPPEARFDLVSADALSEGMVNLVYRKP